MLQKSTNPGNNTGYQGISLQKLARENKLHYFAVLVSSVIEGKYLRRRYSLDDYGLENAMKLAVEQLYEWHGKKAPRVILNNLDYTKAKAWLELQ